MKNTLRYHRKRQLLAIGILVLLLGCFLIPKKKHYDSSEYLVYIDSITNQTKFQLELTEHGYYTLEFVDTTGQLVLKYKLGKLSTQTQEVEVDLSGLENGAYEFNVFNETGLLLSYRVKIDV